MATQPLKPPSTIRMREAPEMYRKYNRITRIAAVDVLEEYASKFKWKQDGERIFDVGSADGSVTDIIIRYVPRNYKKLVGYDVSDAMVKFANDHHSDERTEFKVLDIEGDLSEDMKGAYDHGFSFCTFHWINDQEKGFTNIFDLLTPGGECLVTFFGHIPIYDIFGTISRMEKWRPWLGDWHKLISKYHDAHNPTPKIVDMLKTIGFKYVDVRCNQRQFAYESIEAYTMLVSAVNPYEIPAEMNEEFVNDLVKIARDMGIADEANKVSIIYNLFVVHCRK